jgi:hypothetical protein
VFRSVSARVLLLVLVLLLCYRPLPAPAEEARLTDIIVTNTRDDLLAYLTVKGAFRSDMKAAILSGVPATFSFYISLYMVRDVWFDAEIADLKLTHTVKYDSLKKEFSVVRSWEKRARTVSTFEEAQQLMSEVDSLKLVPLSRLKKGAQYQLRAKAELDKLTLPFYLHYVLFFVSLWDFETDWYTIDFVY